jgi:ABC-type dipeptide/oligopeptide/nickel transport system permease component
VDIALFGTTIGVWFALPLAILAARNTTPARPIYAASRGAIALARAVPDLVWALLFVTAVGLGLFPGALAISVHSIGMLGRLFAEVIEVGINCPGADHPGIAEIKSAVAWPVHPPVGFGEQHRLPLMDGDLSWADLNLE